MVAERGRPHIIFVGRSCLRGKTSRCLRRLGLPLVSAPLPGCALSSVSAKRRLSPRCSTGRKKPMCPGGLNLPPSAFPRQGSLGGLSGSVASALRR